MAATILTTPNASGLDALAHVLRPGDSIFAAEGANEPAALLAAAGLCGVRPLSFFLGLGTTTPFPPEVRNGLSFRSFAALGTTRGYAQAGLLDVLPCNVGQLPQYLDQGLVRCDVVLLTVSPAGPDGRHSLGATNLYIEAALRRARAIVAEINPAMPWTFGGRTLAPDEIDLMIESDAPLPTFASSEPKPTDLAIAAHVARYVEDGATLQMGIGSVPDAILGTLAGRRDLGIHSGLIGDSVLDLIERGVVTNARKPIDTGITVTGVLTGTERLYRYAHCNPAIAVRSSEYTHAPAILAALPNLVSINSALEVDLSGQVNAEIAAGAYVGGVGGQPDFARAAHRGTNSVSIIALPATAKRGTQSRIVARLAGPVTTARSDVDVVVTEFGAAELRGQTLSERARRLIAIAHPDFCEDLERAAVEVAMR